MTAWVSLAIAFGCSLAIAVDEVRHPQRMWIMNIVGPVTSLYLSVFGLWAYFRIGHPMSKNSMMNMAEESPGAQEEEKQTERAPYMETDGAIR
jgi:hypothetical protein